MRRLFVFISIFFSLITACFNLKNDENIENSVMGFCNAYFNYDFVTALKYCTPESRKWIEYTASSIDSCDIQALQAGKEKASFDIADISFENDSAATVLVIVDNYMSPDVIGHPVHATEKMSFRLNLIERNGQWMVDVRTAFQQQNGMSSHG